MTRHHLPLAAPHRREHTYCAHCPKLCRDACPVSTVQARETTTPWGKMTMLHQVDLGRLPLEEATSRSFYACTGCMRCTSHCEHRNQVADALASGRAEAVAHGAAPRAAVDVVRRHAERSARASSAARARLGAALDRTERAVYVPGCTALVVEPDDAVRGLSVTEALLARSVRVEASGCCGLPLLEAGDIDGFRRSARRWHDHLADADLVVFADPGCQHALTITAERLGLPALRNAKHLTEVAASSIDRIPPLTRSARLRYLDPCRLGRGLGVYDAPRRALSRLAGKPPLELFHRRELAECAGAGGQLPRTDRATADGIAAERLRDHAEAGGGTLVAACPAQARRLRAVGGSDVRSWIDLLAEALGAPG